MGACGDCLRPGFFTPGTDSWYPLQEAGWELGLVWVGVEKSLTSPGFDPRTV